MDKYSVIGVAGEGAYGVVLKCRLKTTGEIVAVKKFKGSETPDAQQATMREARVLISCKHPNIISLLEAFRRKGRLYLVFEYCENNVLDMIESSEHGLAPADARSLLYQLLKALAYLHERKIIHRDVKPENLLIRPDPSTPGGQLKLCDFGFARFVKDQPERHDSESPERDTSSEMISEAEVRQLLGYTATPPTEEAPQANNPADPLTQYVATRWYRAPELLISVHDYSYPVDIWAAGCLLGEMTDGQPLFPGNTDVDQVFLIQKILGNLPASISEQLRSSPVYRSMMHKQADFSRPETLERHYYGKISRKALDLMQAMLALDPAQRPTAVQCLAHPYFAPCRGRDQTLLQLQQPVSPPRQSQSSTPMPTSSTPRSRAMSRERQADARSREQDLSLTTGSISRLRVGTTQQSPADSSRGQHWRDNYLPQVGSQRQQPARAPATRTAVQGNLPSLFQGSKQSP